MEKLRDFTTQESSGSQVFPRGREPSEHRTLEHRHHISRRELRSRVDSLRKQRRSLVLVTAVALAACVALAFTGQRRAAKLEELEKTLAEERAQFQTNLDQARTELTTASKALKTAHASIAALVEQRIPGLQQLELDQALPIVGSVVRDITFSRTPGSESGYEIKAVLENGSRTSVSPALRIVLFDDLGVQVAYSQIGPDFDGEKLTLRPGEIRSLFASVAVDPDVRASYFRLEPVRN